MLINSRPQIALVAQSLSGGGVASWYESIYEILADWNCFDIKLITLAVSYNDEASLRLLNPISWLNSPKVTEKYWHDKVVYHCGTVASELEFMRYKSRKIFNSLISDCNLVHFVSGSPAIANVMANTKIPYFISSATLLKNERADQFAKNFTFGQFYSSIMTDIVTNQENNALLNARAVFAESNYTKNLYKDLLSSDNNLHVLSPSIEVNLFKPDNNYNSDSYILSVGRFSDSRKNLEFLLNSYAEFLNISKKKPKLLIVSQAEILDKHYQLINLLKLDEYVVVKKGLTKEELIKTYQEASLFILPSYEEGLGIVLLEAMSCGIPVISSMSGGPETIIENNKNGFLIDNFEPRSLALLINEVFNNKEKLKEISIISRDFILNNYSKKSISDKLLQHYQFLFS